MRGLIAEGEKAIEAEGNPDVRDVALIAAAQRVERYEIAAYGIARTLAKELGLSDAQALLDETLDEEANADKLLTKIATGGLFGSGITRRRHTRAGTRVANSRSRLWHWIVSNFAAALRLVLDRRVLATESEQLDRHR